MMGRCHLCPCQPADAAGGGSRASCNGAELGTHVPGLARGQNTQSHEVRDCFASVNGLVQEVSGDCGMVSPNCFVDALLWGRGHSKPKQGATGSAPSRKGCSPRSPRWKAQPALLHLLGPEIRAGPPSGLPAPSASTQACHGT